MDGSDRHGHVCEATHLVLVPFPPMTTAPFRIAQGLLQHLAINHTAAVWHGFRSWLRTMNEAMPPSKLVVASALRTGLPRFFAITDSIPGLKKIIDTYRRHDVFDENQRRAA